MSYHCPKSCQGYKEILRLLIDRGVQINALDKDGHTALDAAFEANESEGKYLKKSCIRRTNKYFALVLCN